jgi:tRNA nucleotidyltransferase (CCA-adding enzyme)
MQFVSRFNLVPAEETIELCRSIKSSYSELARERVREEWFKWASLSTVPSRGLKMLADTEWLEHYPEIAALQETPQDPEWHPEGNVFVHTCHCCDALAMLEEWRGTDRETRMVSMLAVLAHDFGKPSTTEEAVKKGRLRIVSPGHEEAGGELTESFLHRIDVPVAVRQRVIPLVKQHLAHLQSPLTDRAVRRLARRLEPENIENLCVVMTADHFGRPPLPRVMPESIRQLREKAEELLVRESAPRPLLQGRHLIQRGMKPGPLFGKLLEKAFEAQLEGEFGDLEGALRWLEKDQGGDK